MPSEQEGGNLWMLFVLNKRSLLTENSVSCNYFQEETNEEVRNLLCSTGRGRHVRSGRPGRQHQVLSPDQLLRRRSGHTDFCGRNTKPRSRRPMGLALFC